MADRIESGTSDALLERLEGGATLADAGRALELSAADLIHALGQAALTAEGPAPVQEAPKRPWLAPALAEESWAELLPRAGRPERLALAAGLLQVHDFWDASHEAAQRADDLGERSVSAYWHAIAHRREPDPGNAAYWFRRVGRHPVIIRMGADALPLLEAHGDPKITAKLIRGGSWDPFAFINLCSDTPPAALALGLQRAEMPALLGATLMAVLPAG